METHIHFQRLASTSAYLKDLAAKYPAEELQNFLPPYFSVTTDEQDAGRGQQGRKWESESEKNLLTSLLLYPNMPPAKQFTVCQYVSVAIAEFLQETFAIPNVHIKWSNDIYIGDKKVVGILIEHFIRGENINYTVVGIGMNINQIKFPAHLPKATSLCLETGQEHDPIFCLKNLIEKIKQTEKLPDVELKARYTAHLYRKEVFSDFLIPKISDMSLSLEITGVSDLGLLELRDKNNSQYRCAFNEIGYL